MRKKVLFTAGITSLVALVIFMIYSIVEKVYAKKVIAAKVLTLNVEPIFAMDSTHFVYNPTTPTILIYFDSSCEHCRYELAEISRNKSSLDKVEVILISTENITTIKGVGTDFNIHDAPHFHLAKVNRDDLFENYGSLSTPHIFVYGADRKLIKEFKGETKIEAILKCIP